jgi:hypothetical protein
MYNRLDTAFSGQTAVPGAIPVADQDWVSGIFRVQRNFYP